MELVLNVNVTETVAGDEERNHKQFKPFTMRSKIATGPNYNFAETFFVFLEYAPKVKVRVSMFLPQISISSRFQSICVIQNLDSRWFKYRNISP